MNEAKKSDVDLVMNALNDYLSHLKKLNTTDFDIAEFFSFMEPLFIKAGYREQRQGGGSRITFSCLLVTAEAILFLCRQQFAKFGEFTLKRI